MRWIKNIAMQSRKKVIIISLALMVLSSVVTFAWFSVRNTPRVTNLALVADHHGNLKVADDLGNHPGTYEDVLDLQASANADTMTDTILSPVTTKDGVDFYYPNFNHANQTIESVTKIEDQKELTTQYIYEKTFYLKAGDEKASSETIAKLDRQYEIALVGPRSKNGINGSYILQKEGTSTGDGNDSAANAIRISLTLEDGTTVIYEPNTDIHNKDTTRAIDGVNHEYGLYSVISQGNNGNFVGSENGNNSKILFTLHEGKDVKVTMRIWIEGTDIDCTNSIAADQIEGQIQFISAEVKNK